MADISGFMKYASSAGKMSVRSPWTWSSLETTGPTEAIGVRSSPCASRLAAMRPRHFDQPANLAELVNAIASMRPAAISSIAETMLASAACAS